jgi:DUF4097 and DUF4098 domain-containing protein YvlB
MTTLLRLLCLGLVFNVPLAFAANKTETRDIASFHSISLSMPGDVNYRVADTASLKITAPSALLPSITSRVSNGELVLSMGSPGSAQHLKQGDIRIDVSSPALRAISLTASGDISARGLNGGELGLVLAGSGDMELAGEVDSLTINLSGSGDVNAEQLKAKKINIDLFGSGNIQAHASQSARVHVMGSGNVTVSGNPPEQIREAHGPGTITFRP